MTSGSIIHLDNALSAIMRTIPPFCGDWDGVSVSDLEQIHDFLTVNYEHFEELIQLELKTSRIISIHVKNIYL